MRSLGLIETTWQDLRYALRGLRKSTGFTVVAVLSLALGIGANTAIYSVIHAVMLRALPYPQPERLVRVQEPRSQGEVSMPELEFWKEHSVSFAAAAGQRGASNQMLVSGDRIEWIQTMPVTADFFHTLGVTPALGREFQPDETRPAGPQAVVLSHALWLRAFGADAKAVGRLVTIDNTSYSVVGVVPSDFWFPEPADAYVPLRPSGSLSDLGTNTEMIARLRPGVTLTQAREEMAVLSEQYRHSGADIEKTYRGLTVMPYQDWLVGDVRTNLLLMFGAVGLLLLIACFNLAGLLLARLASRQKEIAMRLALGGSRSRLLRQFLVENILLTAAGGLAGLVGARVLLATLVAWIPFDLPASSPIRVDASALGFTVTIAFITAIAFSVAPTLTASRLELPKVLKTGGNAGGATLRQRTRSVLVVSEVALSVILLVTAGLLIQSLYQLHSERLGFDPHGVITFWTPDTAQQRQNPASVRAFEAALRERLRGLPGVRGVATVSYLPLTGQSNWPTEREGHPDQDIGGMEIRIVSPDYFETMGIPIVLGRSFNAGDIAPAPHVILVNETVARRWWGESSPLGDRVAVGRLKGKDQAGGVEKPREVVGVVADTKSVYLKAPPRPTVYLPIAQTEWYSYGMNWVVRGNFSSGFADRVRQIVAEIDPRQRVQRVRTMDDIVASTTADSRFNASLFGFFAGVALVLAAVGVYGLLAFSVARRTSEIGTRMALGATRGAVLHLILTQGTSLVLVGLLLGLAGAVIVTRSLASLLFGVHPGDPITFAGVAALMLCVGLGASCFPALRAAKVDPMVALRAE
jgi:putative ABC transport system permease protein